MKLVHWISFSLLWMIISACLPSVARYETQIIALIYIVALLSAVKLRTGILKIFYMNSPIFGIAGQGSTAIISFGGGSKDHGVQNGTRILEFTSEKPVNTGPNPVLNCEDFNVDVVPAKYGMDVFLNECECVSDGCWDHLCVTVINDRIWYVGNDGDKLYAYSDQAKVEYSTGIPARKILNVCVLGDTIFLMTATDGVSTYKISLNSISVFESHLFLGCTGISTSTDGCIRVSYKSGEVKSYKLIDKHWTQHKSTVQNANKHRVGECIRMFFIGNREITVAGTNERIVFSDRILHFVSEPSVALFAVITAKDYYIYKDTGTQCKELGRIGHNKHDFLPPTGGFFMYDQALVVCSAGYAIYYIPINPMRKSERFGCATFTKHVIFGLLAYYVGKIVTDFFQ